MRCLASPCPSVWQIVGPQYQRCSHWTDLGKTVLLEVLGTFVETSQIWSKILGSLRNLSKRWFKYDRDYLCVNKSQFVPVIFEPPCTFIFYSSAVKEEIHSCIVMAKINGFILLTATCRLPKQRQCTVMFILQQWSRELAAAFPCTYTA
jgi:hypothetical protein